VTLRKAVLTETGLRISRAYLETILKNPFHIGRFVGRGVEYKGTHAPLISPDLFKRVQEAFAGRHKPNRCSQGRGKCSLPYMQEQDVSDRLGDLLKNIYVPDAVARTIVNSLQADLQRSEAQRQEKVAALQQRLAAVSTRMGQLCEDKLDGKIDEQFWTRKQAEYREQERSLEAALSSLSTPVTKENLLTVERIFELANKAQFQYLTRNPAERGELLKSVLLNCATDGVSLWPAYRKPFALIFQRARNEEWSGRADLNRGPPAPKAGALPGCATPRLRGRPLRL
jgi:site-specific DNA recombinase